MVMNHGKFRVLLAAIMMAGLTACASRPEAVLIPVAETSAASSQVDMLVATTRQASPVPGLMFSGERGRDVSFAHITVSIPPDQTRAVGEVQWPKQLPGNPATDFVALRTDTIDLPQAKTWVHQSLAKSHKKRVLVFVHGFNNRFQDAVFRFAQIIHDSGADTVPVLFTWPSRGNIWSYGYDRESTNYSRDALEAALRALTKDPEVGDISILAHSMGNWLTLESLRQMGIRDGHITPKISNVMLAAPDVDVDLFQGEIAALGNPRPRFTLFVSQDDRALAVSRRLWGDVARLGAINPQQEPYKTQLRNDKITVVDLTKVTGGDATNHDKFAESPEVVRLIGQRLVAGQTITDSHEGMGDRIVEVTGSAAAAVGSAAGLVLTAPVAVVDPDTRANYNDQVNHLGGALSNTADSSVNILNQKAADPVN
jgi:esterase/lipase superfamily enzyme